MLLDQKSFSDLDIHARKKPRISALTEFQALEIRFLVVLNVRTPRFNVL